MIKKEEEKAKTARLQPSYVSPHVYPMTPTRELKGRADRVVSSLHGLFRGAPKR